MVKKCTECGGSLLKNGTKKRTDGTYQKYICKKCRRNTEELIGDESVSSSGTSTTDTKKDISNGTRSVGIDEKALRAKHDNYFKVEQAARALEKGTFIEEKDFVTGLKLKGGHKRWTGNSNFDKYKGRAGGVTYWSHPESIVKMKNDMVLE